MSGFIKRWSKRIAVFLVIILVFQENVLTSLAAVLKVTLWDEEANEALKIPGLNVTLINTDDTVSGNGTTDTNGYTEITVSAGDGDEFFVSVEGTEDYVPGSGYQKLTVSGGDEGDYTLIMKRKHTVSFQIGEGGSVFDETNTPVTDKSYFYGDEQVSFLVKAEEHYHISSVFVDDAEQVSEAEGKTEFSFQLGDKSDHIVEVEFAKDSYALTVSGGDSAAGSLLVAENGPYYWGEEYKIEITANEGMNVEKLLSNGTDVSGDMQENVSKGNNAYLLPVTVTEDTMVEAYFEPEQEVGQELSGVLVNEGDSYETVSSGDVITYFYKNNQTAIISGADEISINGQLLQTGPMQINASTEIHTLKIRSLSLLKWKNVTLEKRIQLVIDRDAPVVEKIDQPDWTGAESLKIQGSTADADSGAFPASGIDYVVYHEEALTIAQVQNGEGTKITVSENGDYEFEVTGEQNQEYFVYAVDKAGNISEAQSVYAKIDRTEPQITGFLLNGGYSTLFGNYHNDKVSVTVTASDGEGAGVAGITLYLDEEPYTYMAVGTENQATFVVPAEAMLDERMQLCKRISAKAVDKVGNVTGTFVMPSESNSNLKSSTLMIETIKPAVEIISDSPVAYRDAQGRYFFTKTGSFTIKVGDEKGGTAVNSGLRAVSILVNGAEILQDNAGKNVAREYYRESDKVYQDSFVIHLNQAAVPENGKYEIEVRVTDNAGNEKTGSLTACVDDKSPSVVNFEFQAENYKEGDGKQLSAVATDYGFYFKTDTAVVITAKDEDVSSGIASLTYYTVDINGGKSAEKTVAVDENNSIRVVIPAEFKGQIYAKGTDFAGNSGAQFVTPNSAIIESPALHEREEHINLGMEGQTGTDINGLPLYQDNTNVNVTVTDTWSGIREISWEIKAPYDAEQNQSGTVTVANDGSLSGDGDWTIGKTEANLVTVMTKTLNVSNNSNSIEISVSMTDRAGNVSSTGTTISIDKSNPTIAISFDNMTPDSEYTTFYKENRTATVVVTERNFSASNVKCTMTNSDGWLPPVDLSNGNSWQENRDSANPDQSTYTAYIPFTEDGDFTLEVAFSDNAGRGAEAQAAPAFTIDKTLPVVQVSYDNTDNLHENYYGEGRTATITIQEHNFDANRVHVIGTRSDNGAEAVFPTVSGWNSMGDTHTARIQYAEDGFYTFSIEGNDKAGNTMAEYQQENFYVDLEAPIIKFENIQDRKGYNGAVVPVIQIADKNLDMDSIEVTLTGINTGEAVILEKSGTNRTGNYLYTTERKTIDGLPGIEYTFEDFAHEEAVDDIYILHVEVADLAGHRASENIEQETEVMFSVNRYGSVYTFESPKKEELLGKYVQQEEDIILTETNVNHLERDSILITMTQNGVPRDLTEGTDYTVTAKESDGEWSQYTYTVLKKLFAEDGAYTLSVYSRDEAGNINENIADNKYFADGDGKNRVKAEISFGVDKTKPEIIAINLEDNAEYEEAGKEAVFEVKDNLVLGGVEIMLNGSPVEYTTEDDLRYSVYIPESTETQTVTVRAYDAADNLQESSIENILVTTNAFALWLHNTPLVIGTILGGVAVLGGGTGAGVAVFRFRKKKAVKK